MPHAYQQYLTWKRSYVTSILIVGTKFRYVPLSLVTSRVSILTPVFYKTEFFFMKKFNRSTSLLVHSNTKQVSMESTTQSCPCRFKVCGLMKLIVMRNSNMVLSVNYIVCKHIGSLWTPVYFLALVLNGEPPKQPKFAPTFHWNVTVL